MLIRKPAAEAYAAFVDPAITTRFWFTKSSGRLAPGAEVLWEWEMYGAAAPVRVKALEPDHRILIDWGDPPREVEWQFTARPDGTTLVIVSERGFQGSDDEMVAQAIDSQGGFSFVLAALKAFLEHGIQLNLVADHQPDAYVGR
ncbi:MAG: SRPBCC family protein [Dehalococcoidia bacterium]|nr:SRPBCC family protein [Dehalococcoidia bacterium]MCB9485643.1 SRPBCC domain-containing protein [Thermoflexaceae bacterium]